MQMVGIEYARHISMNRELKCIAKCDAWWVFCHHLIKGTRKFFLLNECADFLKYRMQATCKLSVHI